MLDRQVGVTIARDFNDLAIVHSLRSAIFLNSPDHTYNSHFDGNDLSATHLIGYIGEYPGGCIRIRYFADFVRMERFGVLEKYRKSKLALSLARAAIEFCRTKGYRRFVGSATPEMVRFWSIFGGRVVANRTLHAFGHEYIEMALEYPEIPEALNTGSSPSLLIQPEGKWHEA
jgi:GNAT superfamily N-acetyltransferase